MVAMTATRLLQPELTVSTLLMKVGTNAYLPAGYVRVGASHTHTYTHERTNYVLPQLRIFYEVHSREARALISCS